MGRMYGKKIKLDELERVLDRVAEKVKEGKAKEMPTIYLWGPPGIGKSAIIRQTCEKHKLGFVDLRLQQIDIPDLRGMPVPSKNEEGVLTWWIPPFLPRKGKGILFLDELNLADPSIQATAYQLILDRRVGEYELPDTWYVVAAGNRKEDSFNVYDLPDPLISRFVHFEVIPDKDVWIKWAVKNNIREEIIAYLNYRPDHFLKINPKRPFLPYPCPRSWEFASRLWDLTGDVSLISAAVEEDITVDLITFLEVYNELPDIDKLLNEGVEFELPPKSEVSLLYIISTALGLRPKNIHQITNLLKIVLKMKEEYTEFAVYILTLLFSDEEKKKMVLNCELYDEIFNIYEKVIL